MRLIHFCLLATLLNTGCASFLDFFQSGSSYSGPSYFPPRKPTAMSGSSFMNYTRNMSAEDRENAIYTQISEGNIPSFLRKPQPVKLSYKKKGKVVRATIWVLPDYIAIGNDSDYVRMPMTPITAQKLADRFGWALPTRKLVDEIYRQANVKLSPQPLPPGDLMVTNGYYEKHNRMVESQLRGRGRGQLVAGNKKDIVVTNRLNALPTRVAIYGWHRTNGQPIQPLSLVHGNKYADYSHGVRFITNTMDVDGKKVAVSEALRSSENAILLSDEGTITSPRLRTM